MIIIPRAQRSRIRHELFRLGVHRAALFPDLDNAATHISRTWILQSDETSALDVAPNKRLQRAAGPKRRVRKKGPGLPRRR